MRGALETALTLVRNILTQPRDFKVYRVKKGNPTFNRTLGRLKGSALLMQSIGFYSSPSHDGTVTAEIDSNNHYLSHEQGGPIYSLKLLSNETKTQSGDNEVVRTKDFKFPSLDPETEKFLWRRKADLELALR